jgi:acetyltransferase
VSEHYLRPLLAARSVALVGATEREGALGAIVYRNLAAGGLRGGIYPVNPKHRAVFGAKAYARLTDLPHAPDVVVIVTPARTVPGIIADAAAARVRAAVILTSGFGEAGPEGKALQDKVLAADPTAWASCAPIAG